MLKDIPHKVENTDVLHTRGDNLSSDRLRVLIHRAMNDKMYTLTENMKVIATNEFLT